MANFAFVRYRMDLSYNGAAFCGWQIQPGAPTVQGELEAALGTLLHSTVGVIGAGRTDTGVHALHYVAHFEYEGPLDCPQLRYKLNAILPKGISIASVSPAEPDFHARFSAVSRSYSYYLHRSKNPFLEDRSYYFGYPDVDFDLMNRCASLLLGRHDFSCFEKSGGDNKTSICTVTKALWEPYEPAFAAVPGTCWSFRIEADRFLRNMVRAIVGTLLEVGRGKRTAENFSSLILPVDDGMPGQAGHDDRGVIVGRDRQSQRSNAGESVPAHALFLTDVKY